MLDETLAHLVCQLAPIGDEGSGILAVAGAQLVIDDGGKDAAQFGESVGAGELGDGLAEIAAGGCSRWAMSMGTGADASIIRVGRMRSGSRRKWKDSAGRVQDRNEVEKVDVGGNKIAEM